MRLVRWVRAYRLSTIASPFRSTLTPIPRSKSQTIPSGS